ncbi:PAS domain-containing sensor histidine kinase [Echinicola jeungdonensis]|uniref:histidine kinase n=1 Tax=Echinicola jeungdonensis TaxID=709343 RepID=A0ABV5J981_9BACT|nr:PAS domain-containing sensor histidine kinase [Echinicola jeungdonensis]MDN3670521.1 PAS domain-containing sensor histidine kinase [Echinicola jeungdonensis]
MIFRGNPALKYLAAGILLILSVFFFLLVEANDDMERSLAYLIVILYLLWMGGRGKYYTFLGVLSTGALVLGYYLSTAPENRSLTTFSASLVTVCAIWIVIYYTRKQKKYLARELKDKKRLDAMFENATEGILMTNQAGDIIMVNKYAEQLFGYSRKELIGEKIEKLIPQRFACKHAKYRDNYHKDPHNRPMGGGSELFALRKNKEEFPVEISLGYFQAEEGIHVIAFILDITERKKASEQLKKEKEITQRLNEELEVRVEGRTRDLEGALRELEVSNGYLKKMEEDLLVALEKERELGEMKSRFVTTASHEFRTPLSTILSSVFLLENYSGEEYEDSKKTHIKRIKRAVKNMTEILNEFLSLSKLEEGRIKASYTHTDIPNCIDEIMDEMESVKKTDQQLIFSHSGDVNVLMFDKQFLRNILINLISNAIKFSNKGDIVEVESNIKSDRLVLKVTDHGIGIPSEDQQYLFKRFFRAHNALNIEGTGLGLNIVKKYVDLMKGEIAFESKPGEGTSFTVTIPTTSNLLPVEKNNIPKVN